MKTLLPIIALIGITSAQELQDSPASPDTTPLKTASLALGHQEGKRALLKQMNPEDIDSTAFLEGFLKGLKGDPLEISPEEVLKAMTALQARIAAREAETAKNNKLAEEKFLKDNLNAKNVVQSHNGLQYRIIERGTGDPFGLEALEDQELLVQYRGTLPDGRELNASGDGQPIKIKISETIPGFRQALGLMCKGAKWVIFVPSALAYGNQRHSDMIGPNQMLIFELTFIDVLPHAE